MKCQSLIASAFALWASSSFASISPQLSLNADPVCKIYLSAYSKKLNEAGEVSFSTEEVPTHSDGENYYAATGPTKPIVFSEPFQDHDLTWLKWNPVTGLEHNFRWSGKATQVMAKASLPYSASKSLVFEATTIGWRGPFLRFWLVDNDSLEALINKSKPKLFELNDSVAKEVHFGRYEIRNLFKYKQSFYIANDEGVSIVTENGVKSICQVGVSSTFRSWQIEALEKVANASLMTEGVTGVRNYYGSMGNPHREVKDGFVDAIKRPWLISSVDNQLKNRVDSVLEEFAASDAWSYREIQTIRHHMEGAANALSIYYQDTLSQSKAISDSMATQAVYEFIAKTVHLHPLLNYGDGKLEQTKNPYTLDQPLRKMQKNWFNKTSLMWAAHFNDYDAIKSLIESGEQLEDKTSSKDDYATVQRLNRTALTYAVENASIPTIKLLLNAGANVNVKDSKGNELAYYLEKNTGVNTTFEEIATTDLESISPSFNCKLARSKQEKAICGSKGLSIYDAELGKAYKKAKGTNKYPYLKALQRQWLKQLRADCAMANNTKVAVCMKQSYRSRIRYLQNLVSTAKNSK